MNYNVAGVDFTFDDADLVLIDEQRRGSCFSSEIGEAVRDGPRQEPLRPPHLYPA